MPKTYLIIDRPSEIEAIQTEHPEVKDAPLILLSGGFSLNDIDEFNKRTYRYFDQDIDTEDARKMVQIIHSMIWNWFLDEDGNDLSIVDGCSLGIAFAPSIEILMNTVVRYQVGFGNLLKSGDEVFFALDTEDVFQDVITHLQAKIGFSVHRVGPASLQDRNDTEYSDSRKRDLTANFMKVSKVNIITEFLTNLTNRRRRTGKKVLVVHAGKLDEYFEHIKAAPPSGLDFILPLTGHDIRSWALFKGRSQFYRFHSSGGTGKARVASVVSRLRKNILSRIGWIEPGVVLSVMERYIFRYFAGAFSFYQNAVRTMRSARPDLVLLSTDAWETHLIAAQAARSLGIRTALIPHGLYGWGYGELKAGKMKLFDHCLAFGRKDVRDYRSQGVKGEDISVSSFPYFAGFLPYSDTNHDGQKPYRKALILPPDFNNISPGAQIAEIVQFTMAVMDMLDDLDIEVIGIKTRGTKYMLRHSMGADTVMHRGREVPLISDNITFPEAAKNVDLVIGPLSTALIEAGLMGIDYFTYSSRASYVGIPSILQSVYDIVNAAGTIDELHKNIIAKSQYHNEYSVSDLIDLEKIRTEDDLYRRFEETLSGVISSHSGRARS